MSSEPTEKSSSAPSLSEQVGSSASRKIKARQNASPGLWSGLGTMGMVGWTVVVPTLMGAALGSWLDEHYPISHSWTLSLLVAGLSVGCFTAWYWVAKELRMTQEENRG